MASLLSTSVMLFFSAHSTASDIKFQVYKSCSDGPTKLDIGKVRIAAGILADIDTKFTSRKITRAELIQARKKLFDDFQDSQFAERKKNHEDFGKNDSADTRLFIDLIWEVRSGTVLKLAINLKDENNIDPSDLHISRRFVEICRARTGEILP